MLNWRRSTSAKSACRAGASSLLALVIVSLLVLIALVICLVAMSRRSPGVADLFIYCAAGMRYPMDEIVSQYKDEYGVEVQVQYGGSNTLLSQIKVAQSGDLFLAADESYVRQAQREGLAQEVIPLATMRPVIAVRKDAARKITAVEDLLQPGLRVACGNPDAAAVGNATKSLLVRSQHWAALVRQINDNGVFKPTVNEVANDIKLGSVDAGIIWDTTSAQYPELEAIHVPELESGVVNVDIAVLKSSQNPTAALHFARFAGARDKGLKSFESQHFQVVEGDIWEDVPELTFFAGSVNRRALDPIIKAFEQREGVQINTIYNGCGILTGQMRVLEKNKDAGFPDTYMACDVYYLETVKELFQEAVNVSDTDIVIAVQKGNPKEIRSLQDLLKEGVRVVMGQPDQCTIGVLTKRLLEDEGIYQPLLKNNVVAEEPTSALLVPAVTNKSADAALAYRTDTLAESDKVDVITLQSRLSKAVQPFSIARSSRQKHLSRRLYQAISRSRAAFESVGFHWLLDAQPQDSTAESVPPAENVEAPDTP